MSFLIVMFPIQDTGDSDLASINEDIQNIASDNIDPDPVLNDLSSGKVVSHQGIASTSQYPRQSVQNVNPAIVQPRSSSQSLPELVAQPSTSGASGTSTFFI